MRLTRYRSLAENADDLVSDIDLIECRLREENDPLAVRTTVDALWENLNKIMRIKAEIDSAFFAVLNEYDYDVQTVQELGDLSAAVDEDMTRLLSSLQFLMGVERTLSDVTRQLEELSKSSDVDSIARLGVVKTVLDSQLTSGRGLSGSAFGLSDEEE